VPLEVHARYPATRSLLRFGEMNPGAFREGVRYVERERADLLLVTLNKTEENFSPTTMYRDPRDHTAAVPMGDAEHDVCAVTDRAALLQP